MRMSLKKKIEIYSIVRERISERKGTSICVTINIACLKNNVDEIQIKDLLLEVKERKPLDASKVCAYWYPFTSAGRRKRLFWLDSEIERMKKICAYEYALRSIKENVKASRIPSIVVCLLLKKWAFDHNNGEFISISEFLEYKPSDKEFGDYWWPINLKGDHERINVLSQIIKKIKKTNP